MGQHDALGLSGRARSKNDGREIAALSLRNFFLDGIGSPVPFFCTLCKKSVKRKEGQTPFFRGSEIFGIRLVEENYGFKKRHRCPVIQDFRKLMFVLEQGNPAISRRKDKGNFLFHRVAAAGNVGGADRKNREIAYKPFAAVVRNEADMVATFGAQRSESGREVKYVAIQLAIRPVLENLGVAFPGLHDYVGMGFAAGFEQKGNCRLHGQNSLQFY